MKPSCTAYFQTETLMLGSRKIKSRTFRKEYAEGQTVPKKPLQGSDQR